VALKRERPFKVKRRDQTSVEMRRLTFVINTSKFIPLG
jgi:hypothetical protein